MKNVVFNDRSVFRGIGVALQIWRYKKSGGECVHVRTVRIDDIIPGDNEEAQGLVPAFLKNKNSWNNFYLKLPVDSLSEEDGSPLKVQELEVVEFDL